MVLELLPQHWISIVAVCIIIVSLIVAVFKKWMVTYALIFANFLVFVITVFYQNELIGSANYAGLGFRPVYLTPEYLPQIYTLFTSMFAHGGFLHIFGNMFIFFFIGMAFEQRVGWKKFLIIYLISGVCGTIAHSLMNLEYPSNWITLIGASGAIFGIMGAFAYSYPHDKVVMPIPIGIMLITRVKVMYAVILFAVIETIIVIVDVEDSTAHFAHLGGLIGGFILAVLLLRKQKKHTKTGATVYYDPYMAQKSKEIDFSSLRKLANTYELQEILDKIEKETIPQARDMWLDHFMEKIRCPKCNNSLKSSRDEIWCDNCGFKTKY